MSRYDRRKTLLLVVVCLISSPCLAAETAGESVSMTSNRAAGTIDRITASLEVAGHLQVLDEGAKLLPLKLAVLANLQYDERSLSVPVLPEAPLRSVRCYDRALAAIQVDQEETHPTLRDDRRLVAVDIRGGKATLYSPAGPLSHDELDLVDLQANTLLLDRLLPADRVAVGAKWGHADDLLAMLLGLDAVSTNRVESSLTSVRDSVALVELGGEVQGAASGVSTEIKLRGKYQFDLALKRITWFGVLIQEKRSIGHVGPGLDIVARLQLKIAPIDESPQLTDKALADLPLEMSEGSTWLSYVSPQGGWQLLNERRWFVTRDEPEAVILRLLDRGEFIAQCNITPAPRVEPGRLSTLSKFQADIQSGLGAAFGRFSSARQSVNELGYRVFRVVAEGSASEVPVQWTYYLLADQAGRQLVAVFIVEGELADRVAGADEQLIASIQFLGEETAERPAAATPR